MKFRNFAPAGAKIYKSHSLANNIVEAQDLHYLLKLRFVKGQLYFFQLVRGPVVHLNAAVVVYGQVALDHVLVRFRRLPFVIPCLLVVFRGL